MHTLMYSVDMSGTPSVNKLTPVAWGSSHALQDRDRELLASVEASPPLSRGQTIHGVQNSDPVRYLILLYLQAPKNTKSF